MSKENNIQLETGEKMYFNNLLNKLGIRKLYALLIMIILIVLISVISIFVSIFRVVQPEETMQAYLQNLRKQNYNAAADLIYKKERETWQDFYYQLVNDSSPIPLLKEKIWQKATIELNSQSIISDNEIILRVQITAPDADEMLKKIISDMDKAIIDTSDPEIVRIGENKLNSAIYYAVDNFANYNKSSITGETTIKFIKEKGVIKDKWYIIPSEELHQLISGNLDLSLADQYS